MRSHSFGSTDRQVSLLGLGCARIGGVFQNDTLTYDRLLAVARDAGINFFDTADMYSQGESETLLGRALAAERGHVFIATKAGYCLPGRRKLASRLKPILRPIVRALGIRRDQLPSAARGVMAQDFSAAYLTRALEASLRRLRTDYVDLFQLHSPSTEIVERGDWQRAMDDLKQAGKLRFYGIACDSVQTALAALRYDGVSSVQVTYSLLEQKALQRLLPEAQARGVAVIARECLGNGLLVKSSTDIDLAKYCNGPEEVTRRSLQLGEFRAKAVELGVSLARLALDFATSSQGVSVTLVGARTPQQLRRLLDDFPT